jgi:hypothetical protein
MDTIDFSEIGFDRRASAMYGNDMTSQTLVFDDFEATGNVFTYQSKNVNKYPGTSLGKNEEEKRDERMSGKQGASNNLDSSTISYKYRHKNQNSIYYLRPQSNEIWLLDFKVQGFVKETIKGLNALPKTFSSI